MNVSVVLPAVQMACAVGKTIFIFPTGMTAFVFETVELYDPFLYNRWIVDVELGTANFVAVN